MIASATKSSILLPRKTIRSLRRKPMTSDSAPRIADSWALLSRDVQSNIAPTSGEPYAITTVRGTKAATSSHARPHGAAFISLSNEHGFSHSNYQKKKKALSQVLYCSGQKLIGSSFGHLEYMDEILKYRLEYVRRTIANLREGKKCYLS
ncbi:hypothetical protein HA466_0219600 [Hirschfeldia incana]|nr:hypothetical protein HA466_0219600 [Hirschfeldia incana]